MNLPEKQKVFGAMFTQLNTTVTNIWLIYTTTKLPKSGVLHYSSNEVSNFQHILKTIPFKKHISSSSHTVTTILFILHNNVTPILNSQFEVI